MLFNFILSKVLERLKSHHIDVEILIAGKGLNKDLVQQIESIDNVHYLGFCTRLAGVFKMHAISCLIP